MSIALGPLFVIVGVVTGRVFGELLGHPLVGMVLGGVLGIAAFAISDLPMAVGFGAPNGPGPDPPRFVSAEKGVYLYEREDDWLAIHPESQLSATGEDAHAADEAISQQLREHGWLDREDQS